MFARVYRYGYNGMEKDDVVSGKGNSYNYKYRMHDPRLGRFLSVDPLFKDYCMNSPYSFAENDVIRAIDVEGLEKLIKTITSDPNSETGEPGRAQITIKKEYMVVSDGVGAVTNYNGITPADIRAKYAQGNTSLYLTKLPTEDSEAEFLEGKHLNWARKAEQGSLKHQQKLKDSGIQYYVTEVKYDVSVKVQSGTYLCDAIEWAKGAPEERGIIMMATSYSELNGVINSDMGKMEAALISINNNATFNFQKSKLAGKKHLQQDRFQVNLILFILIQMCGIVMQTLIAPFTQTNKGSQFIVQQETRL